MILISPGKVKIVGTSSVSRHRLCWVCSRRFWGNKIYYAVTETGFVHAVHKQCAKENGYSLLRDIQATCQHVWLIHTNGTKECQACHLEIEEEK